MVRKSPEKYLSKKDILTNFSKATESDIDYLIRKKLLKPIYMEGTMTFSLGNILDAVFHLAQYQRKHSKK